MAFTPPSGKAACDATPGATISIPLSVFVTVKSSGKDDRSMLVSFARIAVALFGIALKTLPAKISTKSDDKPCQLLNQTVNDQIHHRHLGNQHQVLMRIVDMDN